MKRVRIAVLMGGPSPERDVSLATGRNIIDALDHDRYDVLPVEISREGRWQLGDGKPAPRQNPPLPPSSSPTYTGDGVDLSAMRSGAIGVDRVMQHGTIDVAVIAMHGPYGEDGTVQGLLELAGVPYIGSGVLASALAMDKLRSRQLFGFHGIPVPAYIVVSQDRLDHDGTAIHQEVAGTLGYPCVVKPNALGSSIGVTIVRQPEGLDSALREALQYGPLALVEEFLDGTEITCGVLEDDAGGAARPLPIVEIVPQREFYTYEAKYAAGGSEHIVPARISDEAARRAQDLAVRAHQILGCRDLSRVDMFVRNGEVIVLEVNTLPGMTKTSLLPDAARAAGIDFPELLDRLVRAALRRRNSRS